MTWVRVPDVKGVHCRARADLAMPPSLASLTSRAGPPRRRRPGATVVRIVLIAALHVAALRRSCLERSGDRSEGRLPSHLGGDQFLLARAAAPSRRFGGADALDDRPGDPALAAQIRHGLDDREFPRCVDHRSPTALLFCLRSGRTSTATSPRAGARAAGAGAAVVDRQFPGAAAHRGGRVRRLPRRHHGHRARLSRRRIGRAFFGDSYRVQVLALRRRPRSPS